MQICFSREWCEDQGTGKWKINKLKLQKLIHSTLFVFTTTKLYPLATFEKYWVSGIWYYMNMFSCSSLTSHLLDLNTPSNHKNNRMGMINNVRNFLIVRSCSWLSTSISHNHNPSTTTKQPCSPFKHTSKKTTVQQFSVSSNTETIHWSSWQNSGVSGCATWIEGGEKKKRKRRGATRNYCKFQRRQAAVATVVVNLVRIVLIVYLIVFEFAVVTSYRHRRRCHLHLVMHLNCEHELALCSEWLSSCPRRWLLPCTRPFSPDDLSWWASALL